MTPDVALETLYRARDALSEISAFAGELSYPWRSHVRNYDETVARLRKMEFDLSDFEIPSELNRGDFEVEVGDFQPRIAALSGFVAREITRRERERESAAAPEITHQEPPNSKMVFMVHGQDTDAVDTLTALLREVGLEPKGFTDARRLTNHPMPYIGDVLDSAFQLAQAVLLIFTPDERVELSAKLRQSGQPITVEHQPRPNVLIEAGIALTTHPNRAIIVEMGNVRPISDLAGRHVVRWRDDTPEARSELLDRLWDAGCHFNREGVRWMTVGKKDAPSWA